MITKIGIVADDYTGANDTGAQFAKHGLNTFVFTRTKNLTRMANEAEVIVVDTESRSDKPKTAYNKVRKVAKLFKETGFHIVYKKIDSTLRGNIGPELDAIMDEFQVKIALVVPAYPKTGRITVGGHLLLNQIPLEKTEISKDPIHPVRQSNVLDLMKGQTRRKINRIDLSVVLRGEKALENEIHKETDVGNEIIVIDATTQEDLKTIARAFSTLSEAKLACGSAGLAEELPEALGLEKKRRMIVVISGSTSATTFQQVSEASRALNLCLLDLYPLRVLQSGRNKRNEIERIVKQASKFIGKGKDVIIRSAESKDAVAETQDFARSLGLSNRQMGTRIATALGEIASVIAERFRVGGMVLTGGDTAVRVCETMGVEKTNIENEVMPGIPVLRVIGGKSDGMRIVTKAGAFGEKDAVIKAIEYLKRS